MHPGSHARTVAPEPTRAVGGIGVQCSHVLGLRLRLFWGQGSTGRCFTCHAACRPSTSGEPPLTYVSHQAKGPAGCPTPKDTLCAGTAVHRLG